MKQLITILVSVLVLAGCSRAPAPTSSAPPESEAPMSPDVTIEPKAFPGVLAEPERTNKQARITLEDNTVIVIELYGADAPMAVSNFIALARDGFYNGIFFHRVEPGFVVQAGDPQSKTLEPGNPLLGRGGPGYQFDDEPVTKNYDQGIVAMANAGANTNGSQFFIMLEDNATLPQNYTIFGKVTEGFEHVQSIEVGTVMESVVIEERA